MYKKKVTLFRLLVLVCLAGKANSSPWDGEWNESGAPLLLFENVSLIALQKENSAGSALGIAPPDKGYTLTAGFSRFYGPTAFSAGYRKNSPDRYDQVSAAFSSLYKKLAFGAAFHCIIPQREPEFTADAAATYSVNRNFYIGANFRNCLPVEKRAAVFAPEARLCAGGALPLLDRMYYSAQGRVVLYNLKHNDLGYGGNISVHPFFFTNPSLSISVEGAGFQRNPDPFGWGVTGLAGYHHVVRLFSYGMYAGYTFHRFEHQRFFQAAFYCNPTRARGTVPLSCALALSTPVLTPNGDDIHDELIMTITGIFSEQNVTVKRWTLVISAASAGTIIRSFSGGNLPPTSIKWDGRDAEGNLVKKGTYSIRLIVIDSIHRVFSAEIKEISVY